MALKVIGLDTAKHVFQVHGADASGRAVLKKRLRRNQVPNFFGSIAQCVVGLEATRGAHYWARVIGSFGHEVRLIAPQFVKPYLKGQKNDPGDAAATCEAIRRPEMRFVAEKSIEQQGLGTAPYSKSFDRMPDAAWQSDSRLAGGIRNRFAFAFKSDSDESACYVF